MMLRLQRNLPVKTLAVLSALLLTTSKTQDQQPVDKAETELASTSITTSRLLKCSLSDPLSIILSGIQATLEHQVKSQVPKVEDIEIFKKTKTLFSEATQTYAEAADNFSKNQNLENFNILVRARLEYSEALDSMFTQLRLDQPETKDQAKQLKSEIIATEALKFAQTDYQFKQIVLPFQAEYENTLANLTISMADTHSYTNVSVSALLNSLPKHTEVTLLLPEAIPKEQLAAYQRWLAGELDDKTFELLPFVDEKKHSTLRPDVGKQVHLTALTPLGFSKLFPWPEDFGEGRDQTLITGVSNKSNNTDYLDTLTEKLSLHGLKTMRVPLTLEGGNITPAVNKEGRKILLVGSTCWIESQLWYRHAGSNISLKEFKDILAKSFDVEEVRILGPEHKEGEYKRQSKFLFHIDQVALPLSEGTIAIHNLLPQDNRDTIDKVNAYYTKAATDRFQQLKNKYGIIIPKNEFNLESMHSLGDNLNDRNRQIYYNFMRPLHEQWGTETLALESKEELNAYRRQLLDFDLIDLDHTPDNFRLTQSYANAIVYKDPNTGDPSIFLPIFPHPYPEYWDDKSDLMQTDYDKAPENAITYGEALNPSYLIPNQFQGPNKVNINRLKRAGITVVPIPDMGFLSDGGLHCMTLLMKIPKAQE